LLVIIHNYISEARTHELQLHFSLCSYIQKYNKITGNREKVDRFDHTTLVEEKFTQFPYVSVSLNEVSFPLSLLLDLKPSRYIDVSLN